MPEPDVNKNAGWKIIQSICLELDTALTVAGGSFFDAGLTPELMVLRQSNSDDWINEWKIYYGEMNWFCSVLETAATLTGALEEADYSRATMAIRQASIESVMQNLQQQAAIYNLEAEAGIPVKDALIRLFVKYKKYAFESIGFTHPNDLLYESRLIQEVQFCYDIFQGGRFHDAYWHWLDHFYYEVYHPWQTSRQSFLDAQEKKLTTVLGSTQAYGRIADIHWLPSLNPALRYPEVGAAIQSGKLFVNFWLEPFGFSDSFILLPGQFYPSFAEPGKMYENFLAYSRQLGSQVQALADPTRLIILRLIRALSMTNTDMAAYLGLSRPTVSIHAKVLREAGLIRSWDEGRVTRHEIDSEAVRKLFRNLAEFLDLPPENHP